MILKGQMNKTVGRLGLSVVGIFLITLVFFGSLNPDFNFLEDYVSIISATGEVNANWFYLFGFLLVGIILIRFGMTYRKFIKDRLIRILLSLFGLGFAFTAIPTNMEYSDAPLSKAQVVVITLGLASWLFGLARISYNQLDNQFESRSMLLPFYWDLQ